MTTTSDRPIPRKRIPKPAPDANVDPIDTVAPVKPPAVKPPVGRRRTVTVEPKPDIDSRAVVQLGVRVSVAVEEHLDKIIQATGRTKRELVEMAIMNLHVPS
ncbi:hypothetical protein IU421_30295 [Nocardia cyriacigeorgica]|uniref:hypothetical protein n=1 Tax=Nocardia cyriacigeorgica TaxID=135487 RepID=UPI001893F995|nr:hypothetical protein [Nocardia cyriacigeorgica]MBF6163058.1 hypothetical protein [Nocardia cyriacigeorgica]MBF6202026.1 hypothetical protein [Nocardia cyriacigeorgica]MBF6518538.1 hypothetical protein [Nocardia cyriacigeorgica]